jgi:hypothetical protein
MFPVWLLRSTPQRRTIGHRARGTDFVANTFCPLLRLTQGFICLNLRFFSLAILCNSTASTKKTARVLVPKREGNRALRGCASIIAIFSPLGRLMPHPRTEIGSLPLFMTVTCIKCPSAVSNPTNTILSTETETWCRDFLQVAMDQVKLVAAINKPPIRIIHSKVSMLRILSSTHLTKAATRPESPLNLSVPLNTLISEGDVRCATYLRG